MALAAGNGDCGLIPNIWQQTMVKASLWVGFVLPGMIDEPELVARENQFAEPRAWAGTK